MISKISILDVNQLVKKNKKKLRKALKLVGFTFLMSLTL